MKQHKYRIRKVYRRFGLYNYKLQVRLFDFLWITLKVDFGINDKECVSNLVDWLHEQEEEIEVARTIEEWEE